MWLIIAILYWRCKIINTHFLLAPILLLCCYCAIKFYIPRRIVFHFCHSAFDGQIKDVLFNGSPDSPVELNKNIGIYHVDKCVQDSRGGIFLRTGISCDIIDTISSGFVYKPNREGTPFGAAKYRLGYLEDDWYWFCVSDDY